MTPLRPRFNSWACGLSATLAMSLSALAADGQWNGTLDSTWSTVGDWIGGVPGTGNTADFNNGGSGNNTITVGSITINTLLFDTANAGAFTLGPSVGTGTMTFNDGGGITINSTVTNSESINANIVIGTNTATASYSFTNNSTTPGELLTIAGNISGGLTGGTAGAKVLTLGGAGNGVISGSITTGGATSLGITKSGLGTWTLSGVDTYSGPTLVTAGTLHIDATTNANAISNTSAVTLGGTAILNYDNGGATSARAGSAGALTFSAGDGTVATTQTSVQNVSLTFSSLAAVTPGATGNFVVNGGTNGVDNKIVLTNATLDSFLGKNLFFGGSNFAWYDAGSFVRGIKYGFDAGSVTSTGDVSLSGTYVQATGAVTAQATATFTTLNLAGTGTDPGTNDFTLGSGQILTVNGILRSGNTAGSSSMISGGAGIEAGSGIELVVRTDGANDSLIINTPILNNNTNKLTKSGAGTLVLAAANSYTGTTTLDAGTLTILGSLSNASAVVVSGGILNLGSAGAVSNAVTVSGPTAVVNESLANAITGAASLAISNGRVVLSQANSYTGATTLSGGTLVLGNNLSLGNTTALFTLQGLGTLQSAIQGTGNGTITIANPVSLILTNNLLGTIAGSGDLTFTGIVTNASSGGTNQALTINNTGLTTFAGPVKISNADTARTLVFTGSGNVLVSGGILQNSGSSVTQAFTYAGNGTLTLSEANTYNGISSFQLGTVVLNGGSMAGSAITVASGATPDLWSVVPASDKGNATLQVLSNYTLGTTGSPSLTISGGNTGASPIGQGTLSLVSGAPNTLTINSATAGATVLTLGGTVVGNSSILNMEVGATTDSIVLGSGLLAKVNLGGAKLNITGLGGLTGTNQTLISAPGGLTLTGGFTLNTTTGNFGGYTLGLSTTGTSLVLTETNLVATPATAVWKGSLDGKWNTFANGNQNNTNWATDVSAATDTNQIPGATTNVIFSVPGGGANLNTSLGANATINSLTFTSDAGPGKQVTISGSNTLTINAGTAGGNASGNGVTVTTGAGAETIATNVALGATQTWTINSDPSAPLTVSGIISGSSLGLTKAGNGTLILSNNNSYTGLTTVSAGTLAYGTANALGSGDVTVNGNGAVLDLGPYTGTVGTVTVDGGGSITGTSSSALLSTTSFELKNGSISANLAGTAALNKTTTGTAVLSGINSFTGAVTIGAGVLQIGNPAALSVNNSVTFGPAAASGTKLQLNGNNITIGSLSTNSTPGTPIVENASAVAAALEIQQSINTTYAGVLQDGTGGASLSLVKSGTGILTLSGSNTYTGSTSVTNGTLLINGTLASSITIAGGADNVTAILGGTGSVSGSVTIATPSGSGRSNELTGGGIGTVGTLTLSNGLTINPGGIAYFDIASTSSHDFINVTNGAINFGLGSIIRITPNLTAGTYPLIGYTGSAPTLSNVTLQNLDGSPVTNTYTLSLAGGILDLVVQNGTTAVPTLSLTTPASGLRVMKGTSVSISGSVGNTTGGADLHGTLADNGGNLTVSGFGPSNPLTVTAGSSASFTATIPDTGTTLGTRTYSVTVTDPTASPKTASTTSSLTVIDNRIVNASSITFAPVHIGASVSSSVSLSSTGADANYTRVKVANAAADANGLAVTGGNTGTLFNGSASDTRLLSGTFTSIGTKTGPITLITTGENLPGEAPQNVSVNYTAQVYSGKAAWQTNAQTASWNVPTNWADTQAGDQGNPGAPGIDGALSVGDTATFDDSAGAGPGTTITLDGTNPSLAAITFNSGLTSYTIATGTGSGAITLQSATTPIDVTGVHTISAVLQGTGAGINKTGTGLLTLSGANTYTGATTVANGMLQVTGGDDRLPTATTVTLGDATANTSGKLILGDNSQSHNQTLAGILTAGTGGANSVVGAGPTNSVLTVTVASGIDTFSGTLGGPGQNENNLALTKTGAGTLILSGPNTYIGPTTVGSSGGINPGVLRLSGPGMISNAPASVFNGTLDINGTTQSIQSLSLGGGGSGSTATVAISSGTLNLNGDVTYNATNNPNGAVISGAGAGVLNLNSVVRTFTVNDSTAAVNDLTISANIQDGFVGGTSLTKAGAGTLLLTGSNSYSGGTTIAAGVLSLGSANALGGGLITFSGGALQWSAANTMDYSTSFNPAPGETYKLDTNGQTVSLATPLPAGGALTKLGSGTLILSGSAGSNLYTGATTISAGLLVAQDTLANSSVLNLAGTATSFAVFQTNGVMNRQAGTALNAGTGGINWGNYAGFAAQGGKLTISITGNPLVWASNFISSGANALVFGSTTADSQVELTTGFTLGNNATGAGTLRTIYVEKGVGGDSALLSGVITDAVGTGNGGEAITKTGNGTLILSGANTYTGATTVSAGTMTAGLDVPISSAGPFGISSTAITLGDAGTTTNNSSPSLLTGGPYNIGRPITIANQATTGKYSVGGSTDNTSTISGLITINQNLTVTQVATSGSNALNIIGGITGSAIVTAKTVTFNNVGAVKMTGTGISNGAGTVSVTQAGPGVTTLATNNTYTGATSVNAGTLIVSGSLSATTAASVAAGATLQADGTINPAATVSVSGLLTGAGTVGSVAVQSGGTLSPGHSTGFMVISAPSPTVSALSLTTNASLSIQLGKTTAGAPLPGTDYTIADVVQGTIALGSSTLTLTGSSVNVQPNDIFYIILNGTGSPVSGTFNGLPDQSTFTFGGEQYEITYFASSASNQFSGGNDVAIQALQSVPEPTTGTATLLGLSALLGLQRFRRRRA